MEEVYRKAFIKNQHVNPKTGRQIKIGGPKHQELTKKYIKNKKVLPKPSPKAAKKVFPIVRKVSPKPSPKVIKKVSPKPSPKVYKKVSPKPSPKVVKKSLIIENEYPPITILPPGVKLPPPKIVKKSPKVEKLPDVAKNEYEIWDNGGIPFNVKIKGDVVEIYQNTYDWDKDILVKGTKPILTYNTEKVFIGRSPKNEMTEFSGGYGPKYDGNSILLQLKDKYIYIGPEIYSFVPLAPITKYLSPMGNSGVPYPYAIDTKNNYYLMGENNILLNQHISGDPYEKYYNISHEGHGKVIYKGNEFKMYHYIGGESYEEAYDRIIKNDRVITFTDTKGKKHSFNKKEYIEFMETFAKQNKIHYLKNNIIVERD